MQITGRIFGSKDESWINISNQLLEYGTKATIVGWEYSACQRTKVVPQIMQVSIVHASTCEKSLNNKYLKDQKQMCGVPIYGKRLTSQVIN